MSEKRGCFKTGCLGCLGTFLVLLLLGGGLALMGWNSARHKDMQDQQLTPIEAAAQTDASLGLPTDVLHKFAGKVVLDLSHGSFIIKPAPEGEGLSARARFDAEAYTISEEFTVQPDSTWVYHLKFFRHLNGGQAIFRSLFMKGARPEVQVFLPQDVPLVLVGNISQGGMEAEFGGLWLKEADLSYEKGGFSFGFSEPLREPMDRLFVHGAMGGTEMTLIGNASPAILDVNLRMGGGDIDLSGQWLQDCHASFAVRMGGMSVTIPKDVAVDGAMMSDTDMVMPAGENPLPVLHITKQQSMGEIEFQR